MNIKQAQKLALKIANYLCEIVSYESPEDINIDIVNEPTLDSTGNTKRLPRYMVSLVTINLAQIADTFIRLFDLVGFLGFDIDKWIDAKLRYNKSREYLHGKRY